MDDFDTKEIRIALDLAHFDELVAAVVKRFAEVSGVDAPADDDEWREVMRHAWDYCLLMADRVQMARTSLADLDALPVYEPEAAPPRHCSAPSGCPNPNPKAMCGRLDECQSERYWPTSEIPPNPKPAPPPPFDLRPSE